MESIFFSYLSKCILEQYFAEGVNKAFPYVSSEEADDIVKAQTPILFRLVHSENFNVGVQALMLLYQISSKNQIASDRFYRALNAKLLTPAALNSSKPEIFLGPLVKAMKNDLNLKRVSAFAKRLLQKFQLDMNHHLIGDEILELAEEDVPPEDIIFHRFYMNKTGSSNKPMAKKKMASEDNDNAAELLLDASDENNEEAIDNMLGSGHLPSAGEGEGDYDYDYLDRVVGEDDD